MKDHTVFLIYLMNTKASVTIKTPMDDTYPLILSNFVKQGTVLGPSLKNFSLDRFSKERFGYNFGSVGIQALEFVDNIANPSSSKQTALISNRLLENIQHEKCVNFSAEKCELLKINSIGNDGLLLNGDKIKSVSQKSKVPNWVMCSMIKEITLNCAWTDMIKLKGTITGKNL